MFTQGKGNAYNALTTEASFFFFEETGGVAAPTEHLLKAIKEQRVYKQSSRNKKRERK